MEEKQKARLWQRREEENGALCTGSEKGEMETASSQISFLRVKCILISSKGLCHLPV